MPTVSEKGKAMPTSPIRRLTPYAEEAKRQGKTVYHLNIGQPDIMPPAVALDSIRDFRIKTLEYTHSAGNESYRRKLAEYYKRYDINVEYSDIMVTTGASEAILFAFSSCLNAGDEIITPEPGYANYNAFAAETGNVIVPLTCSIENDFALPSVFEIEKKLTKRTKGIMLCNPNNPTGYIYSKKELLQIRDIVKDNDLFLFSDEAYREFCYDGNTPSSAMHLKGVEENVVMIDSVSKRFSECGVRIGSLVTKNKDVIETAIKYGQARLSPPGLGQIVGEASIDTPEEYYADVLQEYTRRRDYIVKALNNIPGVYCPEPKGAFYCMVKFPVKDIDRFAQWLLEDFEYNNQTVMIAPGTGFYTTPGLGKNEARLAYVLNVGDLTKAVKVLEEALKVYPDKTN
ncbi:MAG: pyridoxal phosphate-dependent aminotransferase [Bacteroidales bacterium]|nr:pyridoxal phosphate-dependent aminotransferase [Bacteroidales bacterium]MBP5589186.1 pyridoxal phosphate-dependent aminotransferase [Bacteroidales bacterium]